MSPEVFIFIVVLCVFVKKDSDYKTFVSMNKCVLHLVSGDNMFLNEYILGLELRPASR